MKTLYLFLLFLLVRTIVVAQTIIVSGKCISGNISLNKLGELVEGKEAFTGMGTVGGFANTAVSIYWIGSPDNVWVMAFDGQPYFSNACNSTEPPGSPNTACPWAEVTPDACPGSSPLSIVGSGILPITLSGFGAKKVGQRILLNWSTVSEFNNKGFKVQRSRDGIQWTTIGFVKGSGNSSVESLYQFEDALPVSGKNFYRLQQVDLDNRSVYSSVVMANFSLKGFYSLQSLTNGKFRLMIESTGQTELVMVDVGGRILMGKMAGQGIHQLDMSAYAPGIYILQLKQGKQSFIEKLIKQ